MDDAAQANVSRIIVEALKDLGVPNARLSLAGPQRVARDGRTTGRSIVCGPVRVIMRSDGRRIEFRDESSGMLRMIFLPQSFVARAAAA